MPGPGHLHVPGGLNNAPFGTALVKPTSKGTKSTEDAHARRDQASDTESVFGGLLLERRLGGPARITAVLDPTRCTIEHTGLAGVSHGGIVVVIVVSEPAESSVC